MSVATIIDSAPSNVDVISAGYNQVYLIDSDGKVWGEGENALGQLANGETQNSSKFVICGDSQIEINTKTVTLSLQATVQSMSRRVNWQTYRHHLRHSTFTPLRQVQILIITSNMMLKITEW